MGMGDARKGRGLWALYIISRVMLWMGGWDGMGG
jgi:hypothetical protein